MMTVHWFKGTCTVESQIVGHFFVYVKYIPSPDTHVKYKLYLKGLNTIFKPIDENETQ